MAPILQYVTYLCLQGAASRNSPQSTKFSVLQSDLKGNRLDSQTDEKVNKNLNNKQDNIVDVIASDMSRNTTGHEDPVHIHGENKSPGNISNQTENCKKTDENVNVKTYNENSRETVITEDGETGETEIIQVVKSSKNTFVENPDDLETRGKGGMNYATHDGTVNNNETLRMQTSKSDEVIHESSNLEQGLIEKGTVHHGIDTDINKDDKNDISSAQTIVNVEKPEIKCEDSLSQQNNEDLNDKASTETSQNIPSVRKIESATTDTIATDNKTDNKPSINDWVERDNNKELRANIDFYENKISSRPAPGDTINDMLRWRGDYGKLESNHQYIQWLFPMYGSSGMNSSAQPLQKHEADAIQASQELMERVLEAFTMMLDFYGMRLVTLCPPKFSRADSIWKERYEHLNRSVHNHLRITRIMRSIGYLGYQQLQYPWLKFLLVEAHVKDSLLPKLQSSCIKYWIESLENRDEQEAAVQLLSQFDMGPSDTSEDKRVGKKNNSHEDPAIVDVGTNINTYGKPASPDLERSKKGLGDDGNGQGKENNLASGSDNCDMDESQHSGGISSDSVKLNSRINNGHEKQRGSNEIDNFTGGEGGATILDHSDLEA